LAGDEPTEYCAAGKAIKRKNDAVCTKAAVFFTMSKSQPKKERESKAGYKPVQSLTGSL